VRHLALVAALVFLAGASAVLAEARPKDFPAPGIGLGLFASDPNWDYDVLLEEIDALEPEAGVFVVVPWYQKDKHATEIGPLAGRSPSLEAVDRTLAQLRDRSLRATVMPIVLLEEQASPKDWRGKIDPRVGEARALDEWWASYEAYILAMADSAAKNGAWRLVVGSELLSMESETERWRALIRKVRARFRGELLYSANWDHYEAVGFWDDLDGIGVNGYFRLAPDGARPTEDELVRAWTRPLQRLADLRDAVGLPVVITEIGYSSRTTSAAKPWCLCAGEEMDQQLQARLYRALLRVFIDGELKKKGMAPLPFESWYLWNWFGVGGPGDGGYTPRGKPAEADLKRWLDRPWTEY